MLGDCDNAARAPLPCLSHQTTPYRPQYHRRRPLAEANVTRCPCRLSLADHHARLGPGDWPGTDLGLTWDCTWDMGGASCKERKKSDEGSGGEEESKTLRYAFPNMLGRRAESVVAMSHDQTKRMRGQSHSTAARHACRPLATPGQGMSASIIATGVARHTGAKKKGLGVPGSRRNVSHDARARGLHRPASWSSRAAPSPSGYEDGQRPMVRHARVRRAARRHQYRSFSILLCPLPEPYDDMEGRVGWGRGWDGWAYSQACTYGLNPWCKSVSEPGLPHGRRPSKYL